MSQLSPILRDCEGNRLTFWCPGCKGAHGINHGAGGWRWNGCTTKPAFMPSVLVTHEMWSPPVSSENIEQWRAAPWPQTKVTHTCHSYVKDGMIKFLGDCTHTLAGQTVALPEWPKHDEEL